MSTVQKCLWIQGFSTTVTSFGNDILSGLRIYGRDKRSTINQASGDKIKNNTHLGFN